jgi:hypothetical protein
MRRDRHVSRETAIDGGAACRPKQSGRARVSSKLGRDPQALPVGHVLVAGWDAVEAGDDVEDRAGLDRAVEDVGYQLVDVGADRDVGYQLVEVGADRAPRTTGTSTRLMTLPGGHHAKGLLVGGHRAVSVDNHVRALPTGEIADLLEALLVARRRRRSRPTRGRAGRSAMKSISPAVHRHARAGRHEHRRKRHAQGDRQRAAKPASAV